MVMLVLRHFTECCLRIFTCFDAWVLVGITKGLNVFSGKSSPKKSFCHEKLTLKIQFTGCLYYARALIQHDFAKKCTCINPMKNTHRFKGCCINERYQTLRSCAAFFLYVLPVNISGNFKICALALLMTSRSETISLKQVSL